MQEKLALMLPKTTTIAGGKSKTLNAESTT